ncbi:DoxX-like family protein [Chryseolinea serpens]|uniref:DoxX-like family protein n=1 Tax=Chryseolinea serpens TaxID=947013 RepID=A0A1M5LV61_9BACT|nr:DoxX family protein [Chryseolinea serpens]SHG68901.1 DoxX-like family protein [Chryseolinea serpens]
MKIATVVYWIARLLAAVIMLQTLFFKFTASAESVYIFTTVGMEPWGRIGVGVMELIAAILIVVPATAWLGAGLALGLMVGALGMHLTLLGIAVQGDHGYLFGLALAVTLCSLYVLIHDKDKILSRIRSLQKAS